MTRQELIDAIAAILEISTVQVRRGSTVEVSFLDDVLTRLGIAAGSPVRTNGYKRIAAAIEAVNRVYDPRLDSSELAARGGNTVTNAGLTKLLEGLRSQSEAAPAARTGHSVLVVGGLGVVGVGALIGAASVVRRWRARPASHHPGTRGPAEGMATAEEPPPEPRSGPDPDGEQAA